MIEVIYTKEQMIELANCLNSLHVQGIEACRTIALAAQIIDRPKEEREVKEDEPTSTNKTDTIHK